MGLEYLKNSKGLAARHKEMEESGCSGPLEIFSRVIGGLNFLRGLFLFCTFCCKLQVWNLVKKTCGVSNRPTIAAGKHSQKLDIKGATTISASSTTYCQNSENMASLHLPTSDEKYKEAAASEEKAKEQQETPDQDPTESKSAADHIICQQPEKPKNNKVSNVLGSQGHEVNLFCSGFSPESTDTSREISTTSSHTEDETKHQDEVSSTGDSLFVYTLKLFDSHNKA